MVQEFLLQSDKGMNGKWFRGAHRLICSTAFLAAFLFATAACGSSDAPAAVTAGSTSTQESRLSGKQSTPSPTARSESSTTGGTSRDPLQPTASKPGSESGSQGSSSSAGAPLPVADASPTLDPTPTPTPAPPPGERDRAALIAFYQATDGDNWKLNRRWLSDEPLDQWQGVTTNQEGAVTGLSLADNRLTGEIPPEFGNLLSLAELDLSGNQLSGCIPVGLYYEGQLTRAYIKPIKVCAEADRENLVAVFKAMGKEEHPGAIGTWPGVRLDQSGHVKTLDLTRHRAEPVPVVPELARLSKLQALRLRGSGELPPELGMLSNLEYLSIRGGGLTGKIPPELGDLSNLTYLSLSRNQLSGEIPPELGKLRNLTSLHLSRNQLSGEIPAELEQLSNLLFVTLAGNPIRSHPSGCIPYAWYASTGSLPACSAASSRISQQQAGQEFRALAALFEDLGGPEWDRKDREHWLSDKPLGEWAGVGTDDKGYVVSLSLRHEIKGTLPAELGDLTYLRTLDIRGSGGRFDRGSLEGGIPKELGNLSHLSILIINGLDGAGSIPSELFNLTNLRWLDLSRNQLTGEIPEELGTLTNLRGLRLMENQFSGTVPAELGNLTELQRLELSSREGSPRNRLTGEIPQEIWDLPKLNRLALAWIPTTNSLRDVYGCVPAKLKDRLYTVHSSYSSLRFC
jgi:Leucine-rich repeat (LRR) protein